MTQQFHFKESTLDKWKHVNTKTCTQILLTDTSERYIYVLILEPIDVTCLVERSMQVT